MSPPPSPSLPKGAPRAGSRRRLVAGAGLALLAGVGLLSWLGGLGEWLKPTPALPQADLFGAAPDDPRDDYAAIMRCLAAHDRCELGPGVYLTSRMISLSDQQALVGAGRDRTVLRLMDESPGYTERAAGRKYSVIWTAETGNRGCIVAELTVDGNLAGQRSSGHPNSMCNVVLQGYNHRIENVKAVGFGYGSYSGVYQECFPLILDDAYGPNPPTHHTNLVVSCEVEGNALSYLKPHGGDVSGIVAVALHGYAEIRDCFVHNLYPEPVTKAGNLHAYSIYGREAVLRQSRAHRIYGQAVYWDSWDNGRLVVEQCLFSDCRRGAWINGSAEAGFSEIIIRSIQYDNWEGDLEGIYTDFLAGEDFLVPSFVYVSGTPRIRGLKVMDNRIETRDTWTASRTNNVDAHDRWIWFNATNTYARDWSGIWVVNNVVDARSAKPSRSPLGNGLWRSTQHFNPANVRFGNNLDAQGQPLALWVTDLQFSPKRRVEQTEAIGNELLQSIVPGFLKSFRPSESVP